MKKNNCHISWILLRQKNKQIIVILLVLFCLTPLMAELCGDVNADGFSDIVDSLLIAQYYVYLDPPNFNPATADVNADGIIDIIDALIISQYYVGLIDSLIDCSPPGLRVIPHFEVSDAQASEDGDTGKFIFYYEMQGCCADGWSEHQILIGGTAQNGVDYELIKDTVWVLVGYPVTYPPEDTQQREIIITPIKDNIPEGDETVIITCWGITHTITISDSI